MSKEGGITETELIDAATGLAFYLSAMLVLCDTANQRSPTSRRTHQRGARLQAGHRQLRVVALAECGTHTLFALAMGPYSTGEKTLARQLLPSLSKGMLLLAGRYYFGFDIWEEASASGAELVWRTKSDHSLPVDGRLADGSYLSHVQPSAGRKGERRVAVRVVEYHIDDPGRPRGEDASYRLITTILAPEDAPAAELAGLYGERWEFEATLDELKTHQRGPRAVLRSKSPEGVRQEVYGFFCTHYAIRALMPRWPTTRASTQTG